MSAFSRQLIHTCTIQRNTPAQNDSGELIDSWANLATGVACRYVSKEEKFADEALGLLVRRVDLLLLPAGTDVTAADRVANIAVENSETLAGPFGIEEVLTRRGPRGRNHMSVRLERVG